MLEVKMNENETKIVACGSPDEIMADITMLIRIVHERTEGEAKKFFEESLEELVKNKVYAKSVEELEELKKKKEEEIIKSKEKELADLLKDMPEELRKIIKKALK